MIERHPWLKRIDEAWSRGSVVRLWGTRGTGKSTLARMVPGAEYLNCDLPSTREALLDPDLYFRGLESDATVAIDEVHRLDDPGGVLRLAANAYPGLRVLAVGSLTADETHSDAFSGMEAVHVCPVTWQECLEAFEIGDLTRRLFRGGLPEPLLAAEMDPGFFSEWIDTFYARDILALFNTRNRQGFLSMFRVLVRESGGPLDFGRLAFLSGQSRPTVKVHLELLRAVDAIRLVRPFHGKGTQEIVSRPRCYAFDTGLVTFERGWREQDRVALWRHLVLDALRLRFAEDAVLYWRDKSGREIDFVIRRETEAVDVVECEVDPYALDPDPVERFRSRYPSGANYILTPDASAPYRIRHGALTFAVCSTPYLDSI